MKVAIIGGTSNIVDPDTQIQISKDDSVIIDEEDLFIIDETETAVSPYIKKWAKENKIPVIEMGFKPYVYKGDHENDYWGSHIAWYKDIVQNADKLYVYCDEDYVYGELTMFAAGYALYLNKEVEIISQCSISPSQSAMKMRNMLSASFRLNLMRESRKKLQKRWQ